MNRFERAKRDAEIIDALKSGISRREVAHTYGLSYATVVVIAKQYADFSNEILPDARNRPRKPTERHAAIVASYRELGTLEAVGRQFDITRERVRQIIRGHERLSGESIERTGRKLLIARQLSARLTWRCDSCGAERKVPKSQIDKHRLCQSCSNGASRAHLRKLLSDELIENTIQRVLAGARFHPLAIEAGYSAATAHCLTAGVYAHLRRSGDGLTIARLWPRGVPNWLRKKIGNPPPVAEAEAA